MTVSETDATIVITLYANRRLYDGSAGRYVSLDQLRQWARHDIKFVVRDAASGDDITAVLLA